MRSQITSPLITRVLQTIASAVLIILTGTTNLTLTTYPNPNPNSTPNPTLHANHVGKTGALKFHMNFTRY